MMMMYLQIMQVAAEASPAPLLADNSSQSYGTDWLLKPMEGNHGKTLLLPIHRGNSECLLLTSATDSVRAGSPHSGTCFHDDSNPTTSFRGNPTSRTELHEHDKKSSTELCSLFSSKETFLSDRSPVLGSKVKYSQEIASFLHTQPLPSMEDLIALLLSNRRLKNLEYSKILYAHLCGFGIEQDMVIGNYLVPLFMACGGLTDAHKVFCKLSQPNQYSWSSVAQGYVDSGEPNVAISLYQDQRVVSSKFMLTSMLKACAELQWIEKGRQIFMDIVKTGYETILQVANTLIDMYFKFALPEEAVKVFKKVSVPDVISWTALITGYVDQGLCEEALITLYKMELEGVSPNAVTFSSVLKACRGMTDLNEGYMVHMRIIKDGWDSNLYVGTTLLDMYAECGALADAQKVFENLESRSTVSWNTLIAAYAESGFGEEALKHFMQMQIDGIPQDSVTFLFGLKASANTDSLANGQLIHYEIAKEAFEKDTFVGSMLVDMYAKCGFLDEAWEVFDQLEVKDVVSWTAIIGGCTEWGFYDVALDSFKYMQLEDVLPNAVTYVPLLKACGNMKDIMKGIELHVSITKQGLDMDSFVYNALVDMYCRCGNLSEAQVVFDGLPHKDIDTWNILIGGYADQGLSEDALNCLHLMQEQNLSVNAMTYVCVLKACGMVRNLDKGHEIHGKIVEEEFEKEVFVGNSLIDMYAKCGSLIGAQEVFNELLSRDIVSWNALIAGYIDHGLIVEGLERFQKMQLEDKIFPNAVTYVAILKACSNQRDVEKGYRLHSEIVQDGFEEESFVGTSLMRMYATFGCFLEVQEVFYDIPDRDVISWTALVAGCGSGEDIINYLQQMQEDGVPPNVITYICSLKGCGGIGAELRIHRLLSDILKRGFEMDTSMAYTLVEAYVKYGPIAEARKIFNKLKVEDEGFWIATVAANADLGNDGIALYLSDHTLKAT